MAAIVPGGTGTVNATYTYDGNGNMTAGNGRTTTWTSFNKVVTITRGTASVAFDYNGEHTRIRQVTASATTHYITDPATGVSLEKVFGSAARCSATSIFGSARAWSHSASSIRRRAAA